MKTTETVKHTPTPWDFVEGEYGRLEIRSNRLGGLALCAETPNIEADYLTDEMREEIKANAAFIVRACNSYDRDQEVIKELVKAAQSLIDDHLKVCSNDCNLMGIDGLRRAIRKAEASK